MAERRIAPSSHSVRRNKEKWEEKQRLEEEARERRNQPRIKPTLARIKFLEQKDDD